MRINYKTTPSRECQIILDTLQQAVTKALEKKRRLSQYAVIWQNGKPMVSSEDAPESSENHSRSRINWVKRWQNLVYAL